MSKSAIVHHGRNDDGTFWAEVRSVEDNSWIDGAGETPGLALQAAQRARAAYDKEIRTAAALMPREVDDAGLHKH